MAPERWQDYISVDPRICGGKAHIRGTVVPVWVILHNLAHGTDQRQVLLDYPSLHPTAIWAALAYAVHLTSQTHPEGQVFR